MLRYIVDRSHNRPFNETRQLCYIVHAGGDPRQLLRDLITPLEAPPPPPLDGDPVETPIAHLIRTCDLQPSEDTTRRLLLICASLEQQFNAIQRATANPNLSPL